MSTRRPVLLVVDDEPSIRHLLHDFGNRAGFEVVTVPAALRRSSTSTRTRQTSRSSTCRCRRSAARLLRAIRDADAQCQTVLMTGHATVDSAIDAIQSGAMDYLSKPRLRRLGQLLRPSSRKRSPARRGGRRQEARGTWCAAG